MSRARFANLAGDYGRPDSLVGRVHVTPPRREALARPASTTFFDALARNSPLLSWDSVSGVGGAHGSGLVEPVTSDTDSNRIFRALIKRTGGPSGGSLLHLVHDDSGASLRGIPRAARGTGGMFDEVVCSNCIEWLPRWMDASV